MVLHKVFLFGQVCTDKRDIKVRLMVKKETLMFPGSKMLVCVKTTLKPDPVVCAIKSTGKLERVAMKNGSEELW